MGVRSDADAMGTTSDLQTASRTPKGRLGLPFDCAVIISPFFWNFRDDMWQTTHNIAIQLAQRVPTILVEPPAAWDARSEQFRLLRLMTSLFGRRARHARPNLLVFRRRTLPVGRLDAVRWFDTRRNTAALRRYLALAGFRRPLLWHSFPYWSESWIDAVDHAITVYHCLDYSPRDEEARIIRRADVVFGVSETLVDKHRALNPRTYLLPNGVDLELFDRRRATTTPRPNDLPEGRTIGFVGSINCHVDLELVETLAQRFSLDHVILVGRVLDNETEPRGPQAEALTRLRSQRNVRLLGFKASPELPAYMNSFDVCLVPFLANPFNQECDPLKFYQYLAFGKPVVTTAGVPVAQRYRDICYPAVSHEDFVRQTAIALAEPADAPQRARRLTVAEGHSWNALVEQAISTIARPGNAP